MSAASFLQRFPDYFLGIRRGFGDAREVIRISNRAFVHNPRNWIMPGIFGIILAGALIFTLGKFKGFSTEFVIARVLIFDYLVFVAGWFLAWMVASKWRRNSAFLDDLIITSLRPAVVANLFFAGPFAMWLRIFLYLFCTELAFAFYLTRESFYTRSWSIRSFWSTYYLGHIAPGIILLACMAWFHMETIRIAHWMFAITALRQIRLWERALLNFVMMLVYVLLLTMLGIVVTAIVALTIEEYGRKEIFDLNFSDDGFFSVSIGAICALIIIALLKRWICRLYEAVFWRAYLLYCWHGAAETTQPRRYAPSLTVPAGNWITFLTREEKQNARGNPDGAILIPPEIPEHHV